MVRKSYDRSPTKPVLDGEPSYENHPVDFNKVNGYFDEGHVRQATYASVFSGACGVTYGCHAMWQFASDRFEPVNNPISHWLYSLTLPGAGQMRHLKDLMLSLPFLRLAPDLTRNKEGVQFVLATPEGGTVAVYTADGSPVKAYGKGQWFDPATGQRQSATAKEGVFTPPKREGRVNDWVLVL